MRVPVVNVILYTQMDFHRINCIDVVVCVDNAAAFPLDSVIRLSSPSSTGGDSRTPPGSIDVLE